MGKISVDGLSLGADGLFVDGKRCGIFSSLSDLSDKDELLGTGVSGTVKKVTHKATGKLYALKVDIYIFY